MRAVGNRESPNQPEDFTKFVQISSKPLSKKGLKLPAMC